jgi:hypothetical protein
MRKLKIAMDQCCSTQLKEYVEKKLGHIVVCRANQAEADESWLGRGFRAEADVYVSRDKACIIFAKAIGKEFIEPAANATAGQIRREVEYGLNRLGCGPARVGNAKGTLQLIGAYEEKEIKKIRKQFYDALVPMKNTPFKEPKFGKVRGFIWRIRNTVSSLLNQRKESK